MDRYRATNVLSSPILTLLFLCQNYHLIRHLYPGVPFYRYMRIWRAQKDALLKLGARDVSLLPRIPRLHRALRAAGL